MVNSTIDSLPFFVPVAGNPDFLIPVYGCLYRASENYWSFGDHIAKVVSYYPHKAELNPSTPSSWQITALKIIACITIVPLILLGIKLLGRYIHPVSVVLRRPLSPSDFIFLEDYPKRLPVPPDNSLYHLNSVNDSSEEEEIPATPALPTEPIEPPAKRSSKNLKVHFEDDSLPLDDCGCVTLSTKPTHYSKFLSGVQKEAILEIAEKAEADEDFEKAMIHYIDYALITRKDSISWDTLGNNAINKAIELHVKLYDKDLLKDFPDNSINKFFGLVQLVRDFREISVKEIPYKINGTFELSVRPALAKPIVDLPEYVKPISQVIGPYTVAVHQRQNDRATQEDTYLVTDFQITPTSFKEPLTAYFFGVFDGHGGSHTAEFLRDNIIQSLKQSFAHYPDLDDHSVVNALKRACVTLNKEWLSKNNDLSGSTASMVIIIDGTPWFFNVGDSRGILVQGKQVEQGSIDAKPHVPRFLRSILKRGGYISLGGCWRLDGQLATARAFGDKGIKGLTARPTQKKADLTDMKEEENNFIVLATDGLWDAFGSQQAADMIHLTIPTLDRKPTVEELPYYLTETAAENINEGFRDNCTTISINLTPKSASPEDKTLIDKELSIQDRTTRGSADSVVREENKLVV